MNEPDAYRDERGRIWVNLRKHPTPFQGVYDPVPSAAPLWFTPNPDGINADRRLRPAHPNTMIGRGS